MTTSRDDWAVRLRELMQGRPVRWAGAPELVGDYDGRERTLEVFNADAKEQHALLRLLRPVRAELEASIGGPVIVIFHTTAESARLYREFVEAALRQEASEDAETAYDVPDDVEALAVDVPVKERTGDNIGTGSMGLPRVAA